MIISDRKIDHKMICFHFIDLHGKVESTQRYIADQVIYRV